MKKETCVYDKENKVIATHHCKGCNVPLCSSCGYVIPDYITRKFDTYCNECFNNLKVI